MKDYFWTTLFLLAVLRSAVAFKIPGLSGGGSGRSPLGGTKPTGGVGNAHKDAGEYMGPVFIIRELDKDKGEYDAFITTGGIQEVKPPHPQQQQHAHNPEHQQQHPYNPQHQQQQVVYQMNPAAGAPLPDLAKDDAEDSEYFGVLITPDTVRTLNYPKSTNINVSLSVLLVAASSRMPWLLVLHRKNYPAFEYQQQQQQQQQQPQPQPQQPAAPGFVPGMQIPQRRRQYSPPPLDRQRRGLDARPAPRYDASRWSDGSKWDSEEVKEYTISDKDAKDSLLPLMFERQLMATMCYNFERETGGVNRRLANGFNFDRDEFETVTANYRGYPVIKIKTKYTNRSADEVKDAKASLSQIVKHAINEAYINEELNRRFPGDNLPQTTEKTYTDDELNRMFPKRVASQPAMRTAFQEQIGDQWSTQATGEPAKKDTGMEEINQTPPEYVSPQPNEETNAEEEPNRTLVRAGPRESIDLGPFGAAEEKKQASRVFSKRVEPQPTTKPLTVEEARAADKVFSRNDS